MVPKIKFITTPCELCGVLILQAGKGRPRARCPICRETEKLLVWLDKNVTAMHCPDLGYTLSKKGIKNIKSRLFGIANLMNGPREKKSG